MADAEPFVASGVVIALRLFDIAYEIDLVKAEQIWAEQSRAASSRTRLNSTPTKAVAFGVPPLELPLEPLVLRLGGRDFEVSVTARLYDFGAATFSLQVPAINLTWSTFTRLLNDVDRSVGPGSSTAIWNRLRDQLCSTFAESFTRSVGSSVLSEDYLVGMVEAFNTPMNAASLVDQVDLVPLLSGEERPLSEAARRDLLNRRFSYYTDDFVALTWDRAFIYEPRGDSDVLEVLEVANAQLLEMRYYDELLDAELPRMYQLVERMRRARSLMGSRRYANLARRLYALVAEVTELTERVDNALQVTEDVYLARIYGSALELFRVATVSAAVERKLAIIRDTYAALYEEASSSRAALMEAAILALIGLELVLALLRR
ncbi:MAG: hypothetical protein JO227_11570 [Acetobacteraceae bacterium]|nr:hypothetical protein [Acetobacteraceae bacterium]